MVKSVVVLASGGIDSTAVMDLYLGRNTDVKCLHFEYGQASALSERKAFLRICRHYSVNGKVAKLGFPLGRKKYEFLGRNALLVLAASSLYPDCQAIALGIHYGSTYYDSSGTFLRDCQTMLDGYYDGIVRLETPLMEFSKLNIVEYCEKNKVPLNLTYSCQEQNDPPCGKCPPCMERKRAYGH